jgi:hypothetical protein
MDINIFLAKNKMNQETLKIKHLKHDCRPGEKTPVKSKQTELLEL